MYPVTSEFKAAAKAPVQEHRLYGTIGSVAFDESNIIDGSFHITNQCTDTHDVVLGSVYTGTLTATFRGLSISRYAWIGKRITVYFGLKTTPTTWEDIPMGIFTIKEAKHSAEGVSVTAYDDMIKLDKKFKKSKFKEPAKIYNFLTTICNTCGLILEDSEQTIQSRPNGNTLLGIVGTASNSKLKKYANDIETYRDLVFWIAQSMACFATINKLGHLMFVPYKNENNVVDEITEEHRIAGAVFDDFTTNYTGIYVTNTADGEEIYYGYDEQELEQEISDVESDIRDVNIQLEQLAYQYQQGQITEAEYKRQKKILDKQLKNLDKRLVWLNEALDKAQHEEDGLYMDLGENPMMQADGVGNTPTTMRRRILNALDAISYTPFTCDTVCGAHYDLGDIIRFTGGHATELGEVCCVMAYDFTMNGTYQMQGFGSDPSKGVMKSKNSKKADKANRNADNSAKNTTGSTAPTSGNDGDLFIQVNDNVGADNIYTGGGMTLDSSSGDASTGYTATAHCIDDTRDESIYFKFDGLTVGGTYTMSGSIQIDGDLVNWGQHFFCIACRTVEGVVAGIPCTPGGTVTELSDGTAITLYYDNLEHTYQITFTATATTYYVSINISYLMNTWASPPRTYPTTVSNMKISEGDAPSSGEPSGIKVYTNDQWKNLDYVKKVKQVQTSSGGTKIATAKNSDGSSTDIYAPTIPVEDVKVDGTSVVSDKIASINTMTGADASNAGTKGLVPAPAAGDNQKFLCGDGTFKTVSGGGSITPNPSGTATANLEKVTIESTIYAIKDTNAVHSTDKGVANGVASLDANGKVPTAQIPSLDSTYLPLAGGEMTGEINTYEPVQDIMAAIQPKTAYYGSIGASARPYRFGYFQGAVLGGSGGTGGAGAKLGTLLMYTGSGAKYAVITPDSNQSGNEVALTLPSASGTLALTSEIPTKTSDLTNDSGYVTTDEKVKQVNTTENTGKRVLLSYNATNDTETNSVLKSDKLTFNPNTGRLNVENVTGTGHYDIVTIPVVNSPQAGWRRVCKLKTISVGYPNGILQFKGGYNYGSPTTAVVSFSTMHNMASMVILSNANVSGVIQKARIAQGDSGSEFWLDVYLIAVSGGNVSGQSVLISGNCKVTDVQNSSAIYTGTATERASVDFTYERLTGSVVTSDSIGANSLAYISKGSGSSKFLREDGTWQTVTASWSGGTVSQDILPSSSTVHLGSSTSPFESYTGKYVYANDTVFAGKASTTTGKVTLRQSNSSYSSIIQPSDTALSAAQTFKLPNTGGTLLTDSDVATSIANDSKIPTRSAVFNDCAKNVRGNTSYSTIRAALVDNNINSGVTFVNAQNCTDNPAGKGTVTTAMICKHGTGGTYSFIWVFGGGGLWMTYIGSSVPASLTFTKKL